MSEARFNVCSLNISVMKTTFLIVVENIVQQQVIMAHYNFAAQRPDVLLRCRNDFGEFGLTGKVGGVSVTKML